MKRLAAAALGMLCLLTAYVALVPAPQPGPDEIAARALASQPAWNRYDEDVKGQIGAAPVAAWQGAPRWIRVGAAGTEIAFDVQGAWRDYAAPMPILARDPFGQTHRCAAGRWEADAFVYLIPGLTDAGIPWIELRYPRGEMRLQIDATGYGAVAMAGQR